MTLKGYATIPSVSTIQSILPELVYIVLIGSVLTVLCWNYGIKIIGSLNGIFFINLVPITAFAITIIQGSSISLLKMSGGAIVICAVIANNLYIKKMTKGSS